MSIQPDTKDWTWVLDRPCPDCGFNAATVEVGTLPESIRATTPPWTRGLARRDAAVRPSVEVWSILEYACHVRDVHRIFAERVRLMLDEDDPLFANWDQDAAAIAGAYADQDPASVASELAHAAESVARLYAGVGGSDWERTGRRSNGSTFTVASLGRYHLHDVVHHVHDIDHAGR